MLRSLMTLSRHHCEESVRMNKVEEATLKPLSLNATSDWTAGRIDHSGDVLRGGLPRHPHHWRWSHTVQQRIWCRRDRLSYWRKKNKVEITYAFSSAGTVKGEGQIYLHPRNCIRLVCNGHRKTCHVLLYLICVSLHPKTFISYLGEKWVCRWRWSDVPRLQGSFDTSLGT